MDWYWTMSSIRSSVPSGEKTKHSPSVWTIISRRRWCDRILETERWSSEQVWALSTLVWWYVEEQNGRRRRKQEKISILYWSVRTRNFLFLSSSRSFRTQYHWSYAAGQCVNSEQFCRVHLSCRMCSQFTLRHKFRIDSGRTKFEQKTEGILHVCGSHEQRTQGVHKSLIWPNHVLHGTSRKSGEDIRIRCIGSNFCSLNGKDWSFIKQDVMQSSFTIHSQLIVSRK